MMKGTFKRALAGLAATALAATGLTLAAGSANAAPYVDDATIMLTGETAANTTYTAYKIGSYVEDDSVADSGVLTFIGVDTETEWETDAVAALGAAVTATPEYKAYGDPLAYVAATSLYTTADSAQLSTFVEALADKTAGKALAGTVDVTADGQTVEFTGLEEGLYMVVATNTTASDQSAGRALAIIGTKITVDGVEYSELNSVRLGTAEVKPSTPQKPGKTGTVLDGTTAYPGKEIQYVLTGTVPEYVDGTFAFVDTPGVGLTVPVTADNIKVYTDYNAQTGTGTAVTGVTLTPAGETITGDDKTSFKVTLNTPADYADKEITVVYTAVVNAAAADTVTNTVRFDDPTSQIITDTKIVNKNTITFTKQGVDGDSEFLNGVEFQIEALSTDNNVGLPDGYVVTATSAGTGTVTFGNLPNGTYRITETNPIKGYMDTNTSFTVTVKDGQVTNFQGDQLGLVQQDENTGAITVKNVKSVTQLPLTGAAGTALFTVLGLLIAGIGVLAYVKSRSVRSTLRRG